MSDETEQLEIDDLFPPFQRHSATSFQAAMEIEPSSMTLRKQVLEYLRRCGGQGATDDEIQIALHMNPSTQRPRRIELLRMGLVLESTYKRKTQSGRNARVWVAVT